MNNNSNNDINSNSIINKNIKNKEEIFFNSFNDKDFSYIPIKLCFIGHSFSGRRTQAKLLSEKYKNLKSYSINEICQFFIDEYKRLHMPFEKNPKLNHLKKHQINQMKEQKEEDLKKYKYIFILIKNYLNIDKNKEIDINTLTLNVQELPDELKINLLLYEIKKDFPKKTEEEINNEIQIRNEKKEKLEEELKKLKEEMKDDTLNTNKIKENKKSKHKSKKNIHNNIGNITQELENIINESIEGFILYDYPNNYEQYQKLENITTGYIQEIDKYPDKRDAYINILTSSIDKPYINISKTNKEASIHLGCKNDLKKNSFFNCYILLELSEEETLKTMNNRVNDPKTDIIYHLEYSPPNPKDKKLNERLIPLTEPNDEKIKELISNFYTEYPKILYFLYLFNNLYRIDIEDKDEIFKKIENIIFKEIKEYEERENKLIFCNLINSSEIMEETEIIKYFKKLNEVKK